MSYGKLITRFTSGGHDIFITCPAQSMHLEPFGLSVHVFCGTGDENIIPTCREAGNYYLSACAKLLVVANLAMRVLQIFNQWWYKFAFSLLRNHHLSVIVRCKILKEKKHLSRLVTKPAYWHVRPAKTQISLGIRSVWSESSQCAQWVADAKTDPSLRCAHMPFCWFCHEASRFKSKSCFVIFPVNW